MSDETELEEVRRQIAELRKVEAQWVAFLADEAKPERDRRRGQLLRDAVLAGTVGPLPTDWLTKLHEAAEDDERWLWEQRFLLGDGWRIDKDGVHVPPSRSVDSTPAD